MDVKTIENDIQILKSKEIFFRIQLANATELLKKAHDERMIKEGILYRMLNYHPDMEA